MKQIQIFVLLQLIIFLWGYEAFAQDERALKVHEENQYFADQGDGTFVNPVLPGRFADPSVIRVGSNFYMTHSGGSGDGLLIWHSRDLVNWRPLTRVNTGDSGSPWAPDLVYVDGMFFIYVTMAYNQPSGERTFGNFVFYADRIEGPWSSPFNLNISGLIDPGHVVTKNGERFIHLSSGMAVPLNDTGDAPLDTLRKVYEGWAYPNNWVVECPCLESPKLFYKDDMLYLVSAMGGTAGPSTSHMAIVARSENPMGPWENSPYNPLIRTKNRSEKWWSTGHATLIDDTEGNWWAMFHGYENGYRSLGRQTLLMPVAWSDDGWPIISDSLSMDAKIAKPVGQDIGHGMVLSDNFMSDELGIQWGFPTQDCKCNFMSGGGELAVMAHGDNVPESALISICPVNKAYEVSVHLKIDPTTEGGIVFYGEREMYSGLGLKDSALVLYGNGKVQRGKVGEIPAWTGNSIWFKLQNIHHDLIFYYSADGVTWTKLPRSMNDAILGRTYVALYGLGMGNVIFKEFKYLGLEN